MNLSLREAYYYDALLTFSASLPPIFGFPGRPWNGRMLTRSEALAARTAFYRSVDAGEPIIFAAQAAHEVLSEIALS